MIEGTEAKLTISRMSLGKEDTLWIDGKIESNNRPGEELSGSDFFQFDGLVSVNINEIDEDIKVGDAIDIKFIDKWWRVTEAKVLPIDIKESKIECDPKGCKACRYGEEINGIKTGFCSLQG